MAAAAAAGCFWLIGLIAFLNSVPQADGRAPGETRAPQAIAVLTGGPARIDAGMTLLEAGAGERLLISGVNPSTSRAQIADLWAGDEDLFDCCVDLGLKAETTSGNAEEVGEWMATHRYTELILVTSDYHMPRALVEIRRRAPTARVTPFPVFSGRLNHHSRPISLVDWRVIAGEYTKYLAARFRAAIL